MITTEYGAFLDEKPDFKYAIDRQTGRFLNAEYVRECLISQLKYRIRNYRYDTKKGRSNTKNLINRLEKIKTSLPVIEPILHNRYFLYFGNKKEILENYTKMCEELYGKQEILPLEITKIIHCANCDEIIENDNGKKRQYCPECLEDGFVCYDCREYFDNDEKHEAENHEYCDNCFSDNFLACYCCDKVVSNDDAKEGSDCNLYCEQCFDKKFSVCDDCGKVFKNAGCYENNNGNEICDSCAENYFTCESCNNVCHNDNYGQDGFCDSCYRDKSEHIHDYGYKPEAEFFKLNTEKKNELYFGIELEVENTKQRETNDDTAEYLIDRNDFIYCKEDGSLYNGFEIVTHPLSWGYYLENKKKFAFMCDYLKRKGFESYTPGTCGIHVHLSKKAFTTIHLYKFMTFFFKNQGFITTISQREKKHLDRWASLEDSKEDIVYKARNKSGNSERYVAINLKNEKTVEIRIFRGTLKTMSFFKNMEFIKAVYEWTKTTSLQGITIKNFLKYIHENKKDYFNLFVFLMARKLTTNTEV